MKDKDINVSNKYVVVRVIAFFLAIALAITAFAIGVTKIGHKETGYQIVTAESDDEVPLYSSEIEFRHYFEGSSNEIKQNLKLLSEEYSIVLKRGYKLLDSKNEYAAYQNIATLNANHGAEISVNAELYAVLQDAYAKTQEQKGFNMFAGALYNEWNSILMLDEPQEFDPLNNENERERIAKITGMVNDLSNFTLEFLDDEKYSVRFTVSDAYENFAEEMELDANTLDLNTLHDAYLCDIVEAVLEEKGYSRGYIITDSGVCLALSEHNTGKYLVYDTADGTIQVGGADVKGGTVCSTLRSTALSEDELGYYEIGGHLRNPNFSVKTGDFNELISSSYVVSLKSAADTVYMNAVMQSCENEEELAAVTDIGAFSVMYILQNTAKTVCVNPSAYRIFDLFDGVDYTIVSR